MAFSNGACQVITKPLLISVTVKFLGGPGRGPGIGIKCHYHIYIRYTCSSNFILKITRLILIFTQNLKNTVFDKYAYNPHNLKYIFTIIMIFYFILFGFTYTSYEKDRKWIQILVKKSLSAS